MKKSGRKPLNVNRRRKTISVRILPETEQLLRDNKVKLGLFIDQGVYAQFSPKSLDEPGEIDNFEAYDVITEMARGLMAMIVERGTSHLSIEQIDLLSEDFTNLVNHFSATFRKR
jgi:hypothetical protein